MKKSAIFALVACLAMGSASLAITVDGNLDDWPTYLLTDDAVGDNGLGDLIRCGARIEGGVGSGGVLYAAFELDAPIADFLSGSNDIWAGIYLDVDAQGGPGDTDSSLYIGDANQLGHEWKKVTDGNLGHEGVDICIEWGGNTDHWGEGYNFWGGDPGNPANYDNIAYQGNAVANGHVANEGNVLEMSCPISEILNELGMAHFSDDVTPASTWLVGLRVEAHYASGDTWNADNSDAIYALNIPGDATEDGFVGGDDLDIVRANWGQTVEVGDFAHGDLSGPGGVVDGFVGGDDLDVVRANWGRDAIHHVYTPPTAGAVPEPSTLTMLAAAVLSLWGLRQKK